MLPTTRQKAERHSAVSPSIVTLINSGLTSRILTCIELKGNCLFVLVSGYVCYD